MTTERMHTTAHHVDVAAPAGVVYALIADTPSWPRCFPPTVHVEQLEFDGVSERLRMWATADGSIRSWTSSRQLFAAERRIVFRQDTPAAPVRSMLGTWSVEAVDARTCRLTLLHDFTVTGDDPGDTAWVAHALDTNSRIQLDGLRTTAESWQRLDELVLTFEDRIRVRGGAELLYDFLYRAADWPGRVPHVVRLDLTEDQPGVQVVSMDTTTAHGSTHTTKCVRVCFPHAGRIVHKQTLTPALMAAHTGEWSVVPDETGVTVSSRHSVVLRAQAVEAVLGAGATVSDARRHVREELGRTSLTTLELARRHAQSTVRML